MTPMKEILLHNWKAKLTCLILAIVLWYLIKQNVGRTFDRFEFIRAQEASRFQSQQILPYEPKSPTQTFRN